MKRNITKIDNLIESVREISESRKFHNSTKIKNFKSDKIIPHNRWPESWKKIYYKAYPRLDQAILPKPSSKIFSLRKAILGRESWRSFSKEPLTLEELSDLLFYSAGMKNYVKRDGLTKRTYPSAGARYPLEIYPFIFNVKKLKSAVFHYHVKTHSLELILEEPFMEETLKQFSQPWLRKAALLLIVTAIFDRNETKYKDRGYRHILTEYGHIAQNTYLISTALELGCCSIGGFIDDGLNQILDIDGIDESVIGVVAVGKKSDK